MRLGVIGAGKIVPFHLDAALHLGFVLEGIVARDNSKTAQLVAARYNFKKYHANLDSFLGSINSYDAILIASDVISLFQILEKVSKYNIPILIEKPIFMNLSQLGELDTIVNKDKILVGYNRRYYKTIQRLRQLIIENPEARVHFKIPELSGLEDIDHELIREKVLGNTVHMIDLLQFCLGTEALNVNNLKTLVKTSNVARFDLSSDGSKTCELMFGYSDNYSIEALFDGKRHVVKPLETITAYSSMEVLPPDESIPFRRYIPKASSQGLDTFHEKPDQKPGFLGQFEELTNIIQGKRGQIGATFDDSVRVSNFAFHFLDLFLKDD